MNPTNSDRVLLLRYAAWFRLLGVVSGLLRGRPETTSGVEWCCHAALAEGDATTLFPHYTRMGDTKPNEHDEELLWHRLNAVCTKLEDILRKAPTRVETRMILRVLDVLNYKNVDWRKIRRDLPF